MINDKLQKHTIYFQRQKVITISPYREPLKLERKKKKKL
jgi:hypothetical protein